MTNTTKHRNRIGGRRDRQQAAVGSCERRVEFWSTQTDEEIDFDGKTVNVAAKLKIAESDLSNLRNKLSPVRKMEE